MTTLNEILCTGDNRAKVVQDAARLVEDEVASKKGLSGMAVKAAFKAVKKVKPGLIPETVDHLLEEFVGRMEPFMDKWEGAGRKPDFETFLNQNANDVTNALLGVTDDRAKKADNRILTRAYYSLRPQGEKNVKAAMPGIGRMMRKYVV